MWFEELPQGHRGPAKTLRVNSQAESSSQLKQAVSERALARFSY
jgi:hypothetical protein